MTPIDYPVLILPGFRNSGPQHWQTRWEQDHPSWQRVMQRDWESPVCNEWTAVLDAAIAKFSTPPLLVAHSLGCLLAVHWLAHSTVPVRAAFLVAVPNPLEENFPSTARGFAPVPRVRLRMPSLVIASANDPYGSVDYVRRCASDWGSDLEMIGQAGHINAESGLGDWQEGLLLLQQLLAQRTESI